ncbi:hypothetical protein AB7C87_13465 [Natrarchaeobius sp. A-rgal3]|uniref:DUF7331 family protein n=1 Tax=Natrarchaeobius versutus TaxID=1679078 RepID=UPI00350F61EE
MPAHDAPPDSRSDPDAPTVPSTIVARIEGDGRVTIYDEETQAAWISSTYAVSLRNAP